MTALTPGTEAELAQIVTDADAPLRVQGGGTRPIGGPTNGAILSTSALTGVELYEPGALTLVVRAGTPVADVEKTLAVEGQRLAFEPMDHRGLLGTSGEPTIGGVVAANVSGPRRIQTGACRDHLLGVRFVDGQGRIIKNGGRVMKNVTGYDLVKLMAGSYGTLGVLTEVSLKVLPKSHFTGTLLLEGLSDTDAVRALSAALGSPFEVTGAAHLQQSENGAPLTMLRLEGFENSVRYRASELQKKLSAFGAFVLEDDASQATTRWRSVRDVAPFHDMAGDVWRISVKPGDAPDVVATLPGTQALYDWGGGLIWLLVPEGLNVTGDQVRAAFADRGGHATLIRGQSGATFQPLSPAVAALQTGLRQKFDPMGLLNPGLMGQAA